jgi:N-acylneuraminate cytidylyltransferase
VNVAFIPVRGGSKSIPLKNIREIAGKPLVYWTAKAACECQYIDKVYIATDSDRIREIAGGFGFVKLEVIGRSPESASDTASTESAMLEFANQYEFDNIVLIQATSPLLTAEDLDGGFELFHSPNTDSVFSAVRQKRFHWRVDAKGYAFPTNYDPYHRPRRQEFDGSLVENGAFYITGRKQFLDSQNRISGHIRVYEMNEDSYFEIDESSDWIITEDLLKFRNAGGF